MLFAEYVATKNSFTVSVQKPTNFDHCSMVVKPKSIELRNQHFNFSVGFPDLNLAPITCNNLEEHAGDVLSCVFSATAENANRDKNFIHKYLEKALQNATGLLCKFCQNDLCDISVVNSVHVEAPVFCSEDGAMASEENYFCHATEPHDRAISHSSLKKITSISTAPQLTSCLVTGTEAILHSGIFNKDCFKSHQQKFVHCRRCLIAIGEKVLVGNSEHISLGTNCVDVLLEERDIDGDFLRYIEKPLIDEKDFYSLLISSLLENEHYRVLVSAITWHGNVDFMLLWLLDQEVRLYNVPLPKAIKCEGSTDSSVKAMSEEAHADVTADHVTCRRVFYRIVLPDEGGKELKAQDILKSWRNDFSVTLVTLPWETCIGLAACLQHFTSRIAPQLRRMGKYMEGFMCGAVPSTACVNEAQN